MIKLVNIEFGLILISLFFLSCVSNESKPTVVQEEKNKSVNTLGNSNPGEYFAKSILEKHLGKMVINSPRTENLDYKQLFKKEGITDIVAYYDTRTIQPSKYEDFFLFVASYDNSYNAKSAFERIKSDAELSNSNDNINQLYNNRIEFLKLGNRYGGLITYYENQIFSFIENCDKIPKGNNWLDLEYRFTNLLKTENGYVEVLKAGCEEGRYYGGKRKTSE
jgi:hypothetical protein